MAKSVRAIDRAFDVLHAVACVGEASLQQIEARTELPRPTVARIVQTLVELAALRRGLRDEHYHLGLGIAELALKLQSDSLLAELAAPRLNELVDKTGWPSGLAVYDPVPGDYMRLIETSRKVSRFYLRSETVRHINLLLSSLGLAYVANVSAAQRGAILALVRKSTDPHNLVAIAAGGIHEKLDRIRRDGYAARDPLFVGGGHNKEPVDDQMTGIAVSLHWEGATFGSLNLYWHRKALSIDDAVLAYLPMIQAAANSIALEAARMGVAQALISHQTLIPA